MSEENKSQKLSKEELARKIQGAAAQRSNAEMRFADVSSVAGRLPKYPDFSAAPKFTDNNDFGYDDTYYDEVYRTPPPRSSAQPHRQQSGANSGGQGGQRRRPPQQQKQPQHRNGSKNSRSAADRRRAQQELAKKRKKQNARRLAAAGITAAIMLVGAGAGGLFWFTQGKAKYEGRFLENTSINGANVSGMTPEEAAEEVRQTGDSPDVITLTRPDGTDVRIALKDIGGTDNIDKSVENLYNDQDHNGWFKAKTQKSVYNFNIEFTFDEKKFYQEVENKIVNVKSKNTSKNAYIEKTTSGFQIVPEVVGTSIDADKVQALYDYIQGFLDRGKYSIDLSNCNCYELPKVREADLREQLSTLDALYDVQFTFDFGYTTERLDGSECINWITFQTENPLDGWTVDEEKVMQYVEQLGTKYDSYGKERAFHSTTRGDITVEQGEGDYGWWIDRDKTATLLAELVKDGISATVKPYYYKNPSTGYEYTCNCDRTPTSDIGDTYCEIDLEKQHFWYYKNGKKKYECDIVSGLPTAARNTPGGVYKIWYKEKDKVLRGSTTDGESWTTPVTYWNNISTFGIGLHDATWHSYFGGSAYTVNGSHGCINMPFDAAKYVFENIEIGTPVVMYW
ncbi:Putative peptidoglycan binding domain-containing protein [Ruminococcus sp. YE71]|uniref:L,D-transpeptidase family protein n=1 Tax=unclassified Ruminococcus TaxID=2608920 RepID=UPI0008829D5F|nr:MULTISPECIES: L,D-transpeptidase family protein [unclassified Ruminococcus]SDA19086.1 Putative peptidoglycan binding domain-containing protein [Ruminococcus sp. YE78]SFW28740.1 Putative peptidoglycan binding domain-containing protein [Ruminococcus sp. YE71]